MNDLLKSLGSLGRTRLLLLGGTGAALLLMLFFGLRTVMAPEFVRLYSGLSPASASSIIDTLEQEGFRVELGDSGSTISVPRESVARARMALADKGLPADGTPGWEIFDDASALGMNSFLQRVSRLRALEGELARSIQTIDGVAAARVHLVLPEREAFSRERPEPSASVIVRGGSTRTIGRRKAQAIRALVAAAIPNLSPGKVTVLSASGETILAQEGEGASEVTLQSVRVGIEERLAASVSQILSARVGAGNARVEVSVNLNSERRVIREQSFNPEQRVVRSTETSEETREDRKLSGGEVGVNGNIPPELAGDAPNGNGKSNSSERTREIVNYEIGKTESETVQEPGEIQRISVAVLVNGIYNVASNGDVAYEERSPEELARLEELVKTAVGFDAARGDTISVDSLRFMDYSMDVGEPAGTSVTQLLQEHFASILRGLVALVMVAVILKFGIGPMLNKVATAAPAGQLAAAGAPMAIESSAATAEPASLPARMAQPHAVPHGGANSAREAQRLAAASHPRELVTIDAVEGGVQRGWIETVGSTIETQPEESLRVVKSWLAEEL